MKERYDVIVAGAGLAGSLAAGMAAKGGASVVLLDRNKEAEVGKKTNWGWVCGDAVANDHLKFVTQKLGIKFDKPELDHKVDGVIALSPDMKSKFPFDGEGYLLDRPLFEAKLLKYAKGLRRRIPFGVRGRGPDNREQRGRRHIREGQGQEARRDKGEDRHRLPRHRDQPEEEAPGERLRRQGGRHSRRRIDGQVHLRGRHRPRGPRLVRREERAHTPQPEHRPRRIRMGLPEEQQQGEHRHRRPEGEP